MPSATTSDYLYDAQLKEILQTTAWTPPTVLYIALFTTAPALTGSGGSEVPANGNTNYARVSITSATSGAWSGPTGISRQFTNSADIVFNVPGVTSWGTITACGIYDAATAGNLLWVGTIGTAKPVSSGDGSPRILQNQLVISRSSCP